MKLVLNFYRQLLSFTLIVNVKLNNFLYSSIVRQMKNRDKKKIEQYFDTHEEYCLQIGCGLNILLGWLNADMDPPSKQAVYMDASEKFMFKDRTFKYIFSEHLIEHLDFSGVINLLRESYRVLKVGGYIRIATPDLSFLHELYQKPYEKDNMAYVQWSLNQYMRNISNSSFSNSYINHIYVINNFHKAWEHQIIFTFETLKFLLETIGFKNVVKREVGESTHKKLSKIERHSDIIPHRFNVMETMVVEVEK